MLQTTWSTESKGNYAGRSNLRQEVNNRTAQNQNVQSGAANPQAGSLQIHDPGALGMAALNAETDGKSNQPEERTETANPYEAILKKSR